MGSEMLSIAEAGRALRNGTLRPLQLVEACLEQIRRFEPEIQAWVLVDEAGAVAAAAALGDELDRGVDRGPLHGIPIGIKDIFDVAGWPTLAGSSTRIGHVAQQDAVVVARLRSAGAIILGKTVTTEFACFDPSPTRNPWNAAHTPGGSSSGSAAAAALGMCVAAIGSQTGGSITRPASYCGVAGMKPTFGVLPLDGVVPVSAHLDHAGPIARTVGDLTLMFHAMADRNAESPGGAAQRPPSLGVIEPFFLERCDDATRATILQVTELLRQRGAEVQHVTPSIGTASVLPRHRRIMAYDAAEYHRAAYQSRPEAFGRYLAGLIEEGLRIPAETYESDVRNLQEARATAWVGAPEVDALLTPATPTAALARLDTTGDPQFNSPWSYFGLPTISLPVGLAPDGMPLALQWIGRRGDDDALLATAAWCESVIGFHETCPKLSQSPTHH
jgi:Asp-tRNA(Asn)/Glu-tRNA(Gln) amidotransferase A subunit family amidase